MFITLINWTRLYDLHDVLINYRKFDEIGHYSPFSPNGSIHLADFGIFQLVLIIPNKGIYRNMTSSNLCSSNSLFLHIIYI